MGLWNWIANKATEGKRRRAFEEWKRDGAPISDEKE